MPQNARSHRKLKIAGIVALVAVVALLGFAGNFLFDFALNPRAPYTMKMMQDSKNDKKVSSRMPRTPRHGHGLKRTARAAASPQMTEPSSPLGILPPRRTPTITPSACMDIPTSPSAWPDTPSASMTAA